MKNLVVLVFVALLFFISACDKPTNTNHHWQIFNDLRLIHYGLDFPSRTETLENCRKYQDQRCLESFEKVKRAKQALLAKEHREALQLTLQTIEKQCAVKDPDINNTCPGAVTALMFFNTAEDDKLIMTFLSDTTAEIMDRVFYMNSSWLYYRNDRTKWKNWVHDSKLSEESKKEILNVLIADKPAGLVVMTI